jgi:hypothetical protein
VKVSPMGMVEYYGEEHRLIFIPVKHWDKFQVLFSLCVCVKLVVRATSALLFRHGLR